MATDLERQQEVVDMDDMVDMVDMGEGGVGTKLWPIRHPKSSRAA